MSEHLLETPGDLFLGTTPAYAREQGSRPFPTARAAILFAMEQAAPASLRGAQLSVGGRSFGPADIRRFYDMLRNRAAAAPLSGFLGAC